MAVNLLGPGFLSRFLLCILTQNLRVASIYYMLLGTVEETCMHVEWSSDNARCPIFQRRFRAMGGVSLPNPVPGRQLLA